jgi:hypothetical protein
MAEWVDIGFPIPSIDGWLNTLNGYARNAVSNAGSAANSLSNFNPKQYTPNVQFKSIDTNIPTLPSSSKPTAPNTVIPTRTAPAPPSITSPIMDDLGQIPEFTDVMPELNLPTVPNPLNVNAPVKDFSINTDFDFPVAPNDPLPDVPTLLSLNIPTALELNIPSFSLDFPTSNDIIPPGLTFSFTEEEYTSPLLTKVKDVLLERVSGGTGLPADVEEAIWNRGRDREQRAALLAERTLLTDRAAQGFTRPTGSTQAMLNQIVQETQGKLIELSREIMIKQAELEQENIKTSIQQVLALEDILIKNHQFKVQRAFEVAKYIQDIQIELFKAYVSKFNIEVEAYKAFSSAYQARVAAELSKIEILKAQIEAEKLKGDINEQNIKIYLAKIEAVKNNAEIYKTLVSAISEKLKAEGLKLEIFKADIEAYSEQIKAKASEYSIYSEQIKGELAKLGVYESKAKVYATRVQAYADTTDAKVKKLQGEIGIQELNIKKYAADIEAFIEQVKADQITAQTALEIYKAEIQAYLGDVEANKTAGELAIKAADNIIEQNRASALIAIQNAQITLESVKSAYNSLLEAQRASGSIYQGIASSALSAINVSANVQGQAQLSLNENHSYQYQP